MEMSDTMPKAYSELKAKGPSTRDDIECTNFTPKSRQMGVTKFRPNSSTSGSSLSDGQPKTIYYIDDFHDEVEVVQAWLDANQHVVENSTNHALHHRIAVYGEDFKAASREILCPKAPPNLSYRGGSKSTCPACGAERVVVRDHLADCPEL